METYEDLLHSSKLSTEPLSCNELKSVTSQLSFFFLNIRHFPLGNTSAMSNQTARRISARLCELVISAAVLAAATDKL